MTILASKLEPIKKERDFLILELKVLDILTHLKSIVKKHTASSSDKKSFKGLHCYYSMIVRLEFVVYDPVKLNQK